MKMSQKKRRSDLPRRIFLFLNSDMKLKFAHLLIAFTVGLTLSSGVLMQNVQAGQPHMENALTALQNARHQLEIAKPDKGGHRENAIGIIDNAISEVKAGIAAGE